MSEEALMQLFRRESAIDLLTGVGYKTFQEIFEAVDDNKVDFGIVPIENNTGGTVFENFDLLYQVSCTYTSVHSIVQNGINMSRVERTPSTARAHIALSISPRFPTSVPREDQDRV